jgi:hypothetical protein
MTNHPNRGRKPPLKVYKADRHYILLREDEPFPALGERSYHESPRAALANLARQIADHIKDGAAKDVLHPAHPRRAGARAPLDGP